ncbi:MAG: CoA transferase, partial [Myxococcota bacterium]
MSDASSMPLGGVRVIEIAHFVAVPAAGALLADLGAEVIKVEVPPRGEVYRRSRLKHWGYPSDFPE